LRSPNPNIQQNRIPGKAELLRLQALADTNARIMRILDGDIEQLQGSYDAIHSRYIDLQIEPEATQSELHKANDLLTTVQNQRLALQTQQDDLRALMHPVRRCPDEILGVIFELTMPYSHGQIMRQSVRLSSVCQRWRSVALDTPRLWSDIVFDLSKPSESQRFLRACILPRLRQVQSRIRIEAINSNSISALRECGLQDIPVIGTLELMVSTPADVQHLFGPNFCPPVGALTTLSIISIGVLPATQQKLTNHDILRLVARFPPFYKLATFRLPNLTFPVAVTNPNITELDVSNLGQVDILRLLQCFPRLQHMTIRNAMLVADDMQSMCRIPFVESIRLVYTTREAWMERAFFPKLTTIRHASGSEAFRTFLSRHPSITELDSILPGDEIISFATVAVQLEKIYLTPPLETFYLSLDGSSQVLFPSLKYLVIIEYGPYKLTLADFEAVVLARCLPMRHPKSQATQRSFVVSALAVGAYYSTDAGQHLEWHKSNLYKESTKKIDEEDPRKVHLSWPEWE
jgi:hypothetical protein